jgi:hypothetical protein
MLMNLELYAVEVTEDVSYDLTGMLVTSTTIVEAYSPADAYITVADRLQEHFVKATVRLATERDLRLFVR